MMLIWQTGFMSGVPDQHQNPLLHCDRQVQQTRHSADHQYGKLHQAGGNQQRRPGGDGKARCADGFEPGALRWPAAKKDLDSPRPPVSGN